MANDYFRDWLDKNSHRFEDPAVYLGDEPGTFHRDWDKAPLKVCVVAASTYDNLTGNMAQPLLVRMLGEHRSDIVVERAFFPNGREDLELFEKHQLPVFSLESKRRLSDFDVLLFSCSFNGIDLNVIKMLQLSGIPVWRKDRVGDQHPLLFRGGQNDANPTPYMSFYDIMWIGDAESGLRELIDAFVEIKKSGEGWKQRMKETALGVRGCLVPEFYRSVYEEGVFSKWEILDERAQLPVKAARTLDMREFVYTTPIVNYVRPMGSGEILVSRGCLGVCSFCQEGHKERPYRELEIDDALKAIKESMWNAGTEDVTLSAFCFSSYSWSKEMIAALRAQLTPVVGLTSQRVDEAAEDEEMIRMSAEAGNRSVSLGVEGCSQRLRNLVLKGASEAQVLGAVENCVKHGYNKVKLFMISNLPTESDEDRQELIPLAMKCRAIKDKYPERKVTIRFSWTDLTINPHTPFQWLKPTQGGRHLSPLIPEITKYGIKVSFGAGKGVVIDTILQFLALTDDRASEAIVKLALEDGVIYFRQVPKHSLEALERRLADLGLNLDVWFRTKPYEEELPWYIVDYGVSKERLWKFLVEGLAGTAKQPDLSRRVRALRSKRPPLEIKPVIDLSGTDQYLLARLNIDTAHRFLSFQARKQLFRRALYLNGVPVTRTLDIASAAARPDDWVEGVDYVSARLLRRLTEAPVLDSMTPAFSIEEVQLFQSSVARTLQTMLCHSALKIAHPLRKVETGVKRFMEASTWEPKSFKMGDPGVIIVKKEGFTGAESEEVYARALVNDMWMSTRMDGFYLEALHNGRVSIYDLYAAMAGTRMRREVTARAAKRLDYYGQPPELGEKKCETCGSTLYYTVVGNEVCVKCAHRGDSDA